MLNLLSSLFGRKSPDKQIEAYRSKVDAINALEAEMEVLSDEDLAAKTATFKQQLANGARLEELMVPAFAVVREGGKRSLGLRMFDVQLIGAMVLFEGKIAEMKTGEGKTLTATAAAYLRSLEGQGVHVVTVNDYLAARDTREMAPLFQALGVSVSCVTPRMGLSDEQLQTPGMLDAVKRYAYDQDVTYTIASEIGFDFMRDHMKPTQEQKVQQRGLSYAIVDEVDSVLVDEARMPLSISGAPVDVSHQFNAINSIVPKLSEDAYEIDEKARSLKLTETGAVELEELLKSADLLPAGTTLYDPENVTLLHNSQASLQAHKLFHNGKDYIMANGEVVLINTLTGRPMPGRRMGGGVQQGLEAKEGAAIRPESPTVGAITFQNLFRTYKKIAGMTGTALTEANEFFEVYGLDVVEVPTNMPMVRDDEEDMIFRTHAEKMTAIVKRVKEAHEKGQPVLVGTQTVEGSEEISKMLKAEKVKHNVLNARQHAQEALIIAEAGTPGAVTIATSMAGRGTDIQLGGNLSMRTAIETQELSDDAAKAAKIEAIKEEIGQRREEVVEAGGLLVIGTERGESRRVDNQLRGRSGRQGDPGTAVYYVSLEDDLMRIFANNQMMNAVLKWAAGDEGEPVYHPNITKTIAKAQEKREQMNFDGRRQLIKFDDIMNDQRKSIYERRDEFLASDDLQELIEDWREETLEEIVYRFMPKGSNPGQWDLESLNIVLRNLTGTDIDAAAWANEEGSDQEVVIERALEVLDDHMAKRAVELGRDSMRQFEKSAIIQVLDQLWREQVQALIQLREGIGLRAFGQRDPLTEYKQESFQMFEGMLKRLRDSVVLLLARGELRRAEAPAEQAKPNLAQASAAAQSMKAAAGASMAAADTTGRDPNKPETWGKVARNEVCPCGSGKKYKTCHGKV